MQHRQLHHQRHHDQRAGLPGRAPACRQIASRPSIRVCSSSGGGSGSSSKPELAFTRATILRNDALNLDGTARLLHISIPDSGSSLLYGRKVQGVLESRRWIDSYTCPGQLVGLRLPGREAARRLYSIASTPYASRRDSSSLSASLIEVVAERAAGEDDEALAGMGPGDELEVSQVLGRGFSSVLGSGRGIVGALESGQPLLAIGLGLRGMCPVRALLSWVPVLAHATRAKVSCLYLTPSRTSAAFIAEWDSWREAGIHVEPVYTSGEGLDVDRLALANGTGSGQEQHRAQMDAVVQTLEQALFVREGGFSALVGNPSEAVCLVAGAPGEVASALSKRLTAKGISHDRQLFADVY